MDTKKEVSRIMYEAIHDLNALLPTERKLNNSLDTVILGGSSILDSLGFIRLIVAVEEKIEDELGVAVNITDDTFGLQEESHSWTLRSLSDSICASIELSSGMAPDGDLQSKHRW